MAKIITRIDKTRCQPCGVCSAFYPAVFEQTPYGIEVHPQLDQDLGRTISAAYGCPLQCISLSTEDIPVTLDIEQKTDAFAPVSEGQRES